MMGTDGSRLFRGLMSKQFHQVGSQETDKQAMESCKVRAYPQQSTSPSDSIASQSRDYHQLAV